MFLLSLYYFFFFFNDAATTEIYTRSIVGSVRCVQETGINAEYMGQLESLILAQNERWRRAQHMQVVRERGFGPEQSGARVSNAWVIYPWIWDNSAKVELIPDSLALNKKSVKDASAYAFVRG
eukprot:TRINITY_DN7170_c0_g1_i4.p3 TRINITY_DN7170_c0_g1~~TRINITY_DN7170_c0_g1_i4.p3  ORF type:complete len:123 (+),score=21.10 TRINITY_DN7170_c0_g1_i4:37-405(+)